MSNLHAASSQWANRPADERFWNLTDMRQACREARANSSIATVPFKALSVSTEGDDVTLLSRTGKASARFTNYAFGQFAASVGAPAGYLRGLPATVVAECLNAGIKALPEDASDRSLLFHKNGGRTLRASLSTSYDRVWDADVCEMLQGLTGWQPPAGRYMGQGQSRPATTADILPGQINIAEGDLIGPSGLYASDHDMFAFLVAPDRIISDGAGGSLMRGIFVRNSEVGDAALSVTFFLMQAVCGNHIVWNATGVHEIRVRHLGEGTMRRAFRGFETELRRYHDASSKEERGILAARKLVLGNTKEEVLSAILAYTKKHSIPINKSTVSEALTVAEAHVDWYGNPRTLWAAVAGLTHASQSSGFADTRADTDRAAGKLLAMANA
ncbi:MAG: hypothetical protein KGL39_35895 [Patescibacteria group bacterium]|nr:hypothetical protein [Patescibacteria group bacterium]